MEYPSNAKSKSTYKRKSFHELFQLCAERRLQVDQSDSKDKLAQRLVDYDIAKNPYVHTTKANLAALLCARSLPVDGKDRKPDMVQRLLNDDQLHSSGFTSTSTGEGSSTSSTESDTLVSETATSQPSAIHENTMVTTEYQLMGSVQPHTLVSQDLSDFTSEYGVTPSESINTNKATSHTRETLIVKIKTATKVFSAQKRSITSPQALSENNGGEEIAESTIKKAKTTSQKNWTEALFDQISKTNMTRCTTPTTLQVYGISKPPHPPPTEDYLHGCELTSQFIEPSKTQLVICDLNGCLIARGSNLKQQIFYPRPHARTFIRYLLENFHVCVWSLETEEKIEPMIDLLFGEQKSKLRGIFDKSKLKSPADEYWSDTQTCKDLRMLWRHLNNSPLLYTQYNSILIDGNSLNTLHQPHNSIILRSYTLEAARHRAPDDELVQVQEYLEKLRRQSNVSNIMSNGPYQTIEPSFSSSPDVHTFSSISLPSAAASSSIGSSPANDRNLILISGLFSLDVDTVSAIFQPCGEIVRMHVIKDKFTHKLAGNVCFGFLKPEGARAALALVREKLAIRSVRAKTLNDMSDTIIVRDINPVMTWKEIKDVFNEFGDIVYYYLPTDDKIGMRKSYAFLIFQSVESAVWAITKMDGQRLQGRVLDLNFAAKCDNIHGDGDSATSTSAHNSSGSDTASSNISSLYVSDGTSEWRDRSSSKYGGSTVEVWNIWIYAGTPV
ncbi:hypothetical protein BC938DRAFT_474404 [Jimgerdemannia flammicorona]|uniref:FCP1 homology domain-containing protein n=1 Tax=Jimgerdemannia flammicorona TaxID=994334 RepID=A0A433QSM7_9FUNG|nr:hypothetical protein BC938DRAFT_474404 [Jimgerdemannia flammicorona]